MTLLTVIINPDLHWAWYVLIGAIYGWIFSEVQLNIKKRKEEA